MVESTCFFVESGIDLTGKTFSDGIGEVVGVVVDGFPGGGQAHSGCFSLVRIKMVIILHVTPGRRLRTCARFFMGGNLIWGLGRGNGPIFLRNGFAKSTFYCKTGGHRYYTLKIKVGKCFKNL